MPENKVPWWRRALSFAWDGIRSGFGVFPRPAKLEPILEPKLPDNSEEIPEEETALTDQFPQLENDVTPELRPQAESETAPAPATKPVADPADAAEHPGLIDPAQGEPAEAAAPIEVAAESAATAAPDEEADPKAAPAAVPTTEPAIAIDPISDPEPISDPATELVSVPAVEQVADEPPVAAVEADQEIQPGAAPERETVHEPVPQAADTEQVLAAEPVKELPEAQPALETVPVAEVGSEPAPVPAPSPDAADGPAQPAQSAADQKADEKAAAKLAARQKMRDESSEQSPFSVFVGQVYDGPLDLLLDLIRKQDIDIYDIPIAKITAQFLAYVNQLKATDVDVAGEFIYTASLLIHIKSKMLLPRAASGPEDAAEDPRRELVERLLEHERFKSAAQMLQQKQMLEAATWSNPGSREFKDDAAAEPEIAADTVDLVRIFRDILERARKRPVLDVTEDSVTVGQMIQFLARRLTMEDKPVALHRLLSHTRSERALIAMFLALLELVRLQAILLRQDRAFSEIFIKKHTGFETVMNDGLANTHDEWR
jgi:segregation and condensation protein A